MEPTRRVQNENDGKQRVLFETSASIKALVLDPSERESFRSSSIKARYEKKAGAFGKSSFKRY